MSHRCVRPVFDSFRTINTTRSLPLFFSIATFVTVVVGWQIYLSCLTAVAFLYKLSRPFGMISFLFRWRVIHSLYFLCSTGKHFLPVGAKGRGINGQLKTSFSI